MSATLDKLLIVKKGGPGSGHHGHAGRKGQRGGSVPGGGSSGGFQELDFGAEQEASNYALNSSKEWLEEHFEMDYPLNDWSQHENKNLGRIRDMYVVKDPLTLKNNRMLREGKDPGKWRKDVDMYVSKSRLKHDATVHRGAALPLSMVEAIKSSGEFTDKGFMSTSGKRTARNYLDIRHSLFTEDLEKVMFTLRASKGQTIGVMDVGEFVLPRNTYVKITGYDFSDGVHNFIGDIQ